MDATIFFQLSQDQDVSRIILITMLALPVWAFIWINKLYFFLNGLSHKPHWKYGSLLWRVATFFLNILRIFFFSFLSLDLFSKPSDSIFISISGFVSPSLRKLLQSLSASRIYSVLMAVLIKNSGIVVTFPSDRRYLTTTM